MTDQKNYERQLSLLLRRELELANDSLLEAANNLVDEHFDADIAKKNVLKNNQLNNLNNVAFTSLSPGKVVAFIAKQAEKDKKNEREKRTWACNDLCDKLLKKNREITGNTKESLITEVKDKARRVAIPENEVDTWFTSERDQEIAITLLRQFISQFTVFYGLKAVERFGSGENEERE